MYLSIIIIAYNEEKHLPLLLNSLSMQTFKEFEVIVVDSNSTDNTGQLVKIYESSLKNLRYLRLNSTEGPGYARNRGAEQAKYERLIFLDADTILQEDFIEKVIVELDRHKPDIATCKIRIAAGDFISSAGAMFLNLFMILLNPVYLSAYGGCFISTKTVHKKLDGFDVNIGVCEDCNYVKKARKQYGYKFKILKTPFYTSDRRAKAEGGFGFTLKYIRIHLYRMFTGKEIMKGDIEYNYGGFLTGNK